VIVIFISYFDTHLFFARLGKDRFGEGRIGVERKYKNIKEKSFRI